MLGWAEIVAATGQFLWPGTGISTVRLWAVFHGRQQWSNLVCHYDEIKTSYSHQLD